MILSQAVGSVNRSPSVEDAEGFVSVYGCVGLKIADHDPDIPQSGGDGIKISVQVYILVDFRSRMCVGECSHPLLR